MPPSGRARAEARVAHQVRHPLVQGQPQAAERLSLAVRARLRPETRVQLFYGRTEVGKLRFVMHASLARPV